MIYKYLISHLTMSVIQTYIFMKKIVRIYIFLFTESQNKISFDANFIAAYFFLHIQFSLYILLENKASNIFTIFIQTYIQNFFLLLDDYAYFPPFSMKFDYFYSLFTENVVIDQLKVGLYPYYLLKQLFKSFVLQSPKYPKMVHPAYSYQGLACPAYSQSQHDISAAQAGHLSCHLLLYNTKY